MTRTHRATISAIVLAGWLAPVSEGVDWRRPQTDREIKVIAKRITAHLFEPCEARPKSRAYFLRHRGAWQFNVTDDELFLFHPSTLKQAFGPKLEHIPETEASKGLLVSSLKELKPFLDDLHANKGRKEIPFATLFESCRKIPLKFAVRSPRHFLLAQTVKEPEGTRKHSQSRYQAPTVPDTNSRNELSPDSVRYEAMRIVLESIASNPCQRNGFLARLVRRVAETGPHWIFELRINKESVQDFGLEEILGPSEADQVATAAERAYAEIGETEFSLLELSVLGGDCIVLPSRETDANKPADESEESWRGHGARMERIVEDFGLYSEYQACMDAESGGDLMKQTTALQRKCAKAVAP